MSIRAMGYLLLVCLLTIASPISLFGQATDDNEKPAADTAAVEKTAAEKPAESEPYEDTHHQIRTFAPTVDDQPATLNTFRIRDDGHLVVCLGPLKKSKSSKVSGAADGAPAAGYIQIYDPEFALQKQIDLPLNPSALDLDASGNIYVGGDGKVSKVNRDGSIEMIAESPSMAGVDMEELKKEVAEQAKKQAAQMKATYERQIKTFQDEIDTIEAIQEDDRSKTETRQLRQYEAQKKMYEQILDQQSNMSEQLIESRLSRSAKITSIAVTPKEVFVATSARSGSGFEVYRTDFNFGDAKCVLKNLRGCCSQMDVYARGDNLYVAENTKFQVGVYDRDGKSVNSFGERLDGDNQGFGSCCNPMNVICCKNGDVLTTESTVGKIRRFNTDGELLGVVGRAKIGSGCTNVALGVDETRDRYYVQYKGKNTICVLAPKDETEESKPNQEN